MKRTSKLLLAVTAIMALFLTFGCGVIGSKSPSEVVIAASMAGNEAKYSEAGKYLSSTAISNINTTALWGGSMKGMWDGQTRNGTVEKVEILKEEVRGEGGKVFFRFRYKNGRTCNGHFYMIKEQGQWKIDNYVDMSGYLPREGCM